jgi:hypothetical protein
MADGPVIFGSIDRLCYCRICGELSLYPTGSCFAPFGWNVHRSGECWERLQAACIDYSKSKRGRLRSRREVETILGLT